MKRIEINTSNEFHILRHFEFVSENYKSSLIGKKYFYHNVSRDLFVQGTISAVEIETALKTKGSKFFKNIIGINTPKDVLKLIQSEFNTIAKNKQNWRGTTEKKFFSFLINYKHPVGFKNLIPINYLTSEERSRINKIPRSSHEGESTIMLNTVSNVSTQKLNTIEVGLVDTKQLPFYFITAFPGNLEITPDFPSKKQSKEDYKISTEYWDNHVFVT